MIQRKDKRPLRADESGERPSAGFRAALPALTVATSPTLDPALEDRVFDLLTAVQQNDGMSYPPEWAVVAHAAKAQGWLNEKGLCLYLTEHGTQRLANRGGVSVIGDKKYTMTKIDPLTRLALKDIARESKVPMQEAIGYIVQALHAHRDALTRVARANGDTYPWEALARLTKGK